MSLPKYTLPSPVYLPSSGGYTNSRLASEPLHQRVFAFRRYSVEEDGRLVARTRNAGHNSYVPSVSYRAYVPSEAANASLHKPYERSSRPATLQSSSRDVSQASQEGSSRKQVDGATLSRLFQQLVPLMVDPPTFESRAAAICAAFDLDPTTSTEILGSFKQRSQADGAQGSIPPATSGPTIFERTSDPEPPTNALNTAPVVNPETTSLPIPFKQQRPFCSGSPGVTTWYTTSSVHDLISPPHAMTPEIGELFIHHNRVTDIYHVWLFGINRQWKCVTEQEKVYHPAIEDRMLSLRANGTPNWITAASFTTIRGRKGKTRGGV
ncbi:hypothetical protein BJ322DRAFT_1107460 [Thelephora terrestris]|uniref:Uncharacterized protein n=1 Tax=Thelephora terrestris TaxID=56493 RepID=A0A9P6L8Q1_9AGAM|nr:hypothetical protein BJ322DRAFT_1107460 [Thelephora terrestris]